MQVALWLLVFTFYYQMTREDVIKELEVDMVDDDAYVARGNGFCDAKYSEDFLEEQVKRIRSRIDVLRSMLDNCVE